MGVAIDGQKRVLAVKRGFSRIEAAEYVGIGTTKFDQLVAEGKLPKAKLIGSRKVWDVRELDPAFEELGARDNSWDEVNEGAKVP